MDSFPPYLDVEVPHDDLAQGLDREQLMQMVFAIRCAVWAPDGSKAPGSAEEKLAKVEALLAQGHGYGPSEDGG